MTNRLGQLKPTELSKILEKLGFEVRRQTGSHLILRHPVSKRFATIPMHAGDIKRGLLFGIIKQAGLTSHDLRGALDE
ncbi:MAG: type II toxin-antitoxin system HicA family toxin [Patescibacteria group bacterium]